MYILKIKGKVNIPDYVQLRDVNFTLIAYFRADRPEKALKNIGLQESQDEIKKIVSEIPFGKVHKFEL